MIVLNLLDGVRQTGPDSWQAKCPSHDDRVASLVIRELDDGRVLLHCFAGCGAHDVVSAVGLTLTDLFPKAIGHRVKPARRVISPMEAFRALAREAGIVAIAASDLAEGKPVDADRVATAAGRLAEAVGVLNG